MIAIWFLDSRDWSWESLSIHDQGYACTWMDNCDLIENAYFMLEAGFYWPWIFTTWPESDLYNPGIPGILSKTAQNKSAGTQQY